jgi:hypothetical protein
MAAPIEININLPEVRDAAGAARILRGLRLGIQAAARYVRRRLTQYPPARRGPMPGFPKSDKQRRYVMMLVRRGEVPYFRGISPKSENLKHSWNVRSEAGGYVATIGTAVSYAPYVQDEARQALYHRITGWPTVQSVAREEAERVGQIIRDAIGGAT